MLFERRKPTTLSRWLPIAPRIEIFRLSWMRQAAIPAHDRPLLARCSTMPLILACLVGLVACLPTPPPPVGNQASTASVQRVIVRHGRMSWVMDGPTGQRDKARAALETSNLLAAIKGRKCEVEIRFDAAAGDEVIVDRADGREVGRVTLHDVAGGATPAAILDAL